MERHRTPQCPCGLEMIGRRDSRHEAADRVEYMDRRIPAFRCQRPREHHMAIHEGTHSIHHWILLIVPLHQYGVKGGDTAAPKSPRALHQFRDTIEDGRCITLRRRW